MLYLRLNTNTMQLNASQPATLHHAHPSVVQAFGTISHSRGGYTVHGYLSRSSREGLWAFALCREVELVAGTGATVGMSTGTDLSKDVPSPKREIHGELKTNPFRLKTDETPQ